MAESPEISILVPAYNEGPTIETLADEIAAALGGVNRTYEIIYIDDGSTDGSWDKIVEMSERRPEIRGLRHRRNFGKSAALSGGVEIARGSIIVTMDADLQDDPSELPGLLARLDEGANLAIGWKQTRHDPLGKRLPSKLFNGAARAATGLKIHDFNSGFKVANAEVFHQIPLYGELHRYVPALAHNLGYVVVEQPVNHRARVAGVSKFGLERYLRGFIDLFTVMLLTRYGRRPGHLFGGLAVILGIVGTLALLYLTGVWIFTDQAIGTRPLLTFGVLADLVAVQLLSVGLISELVLSRTKSTVDLISARVPAAQ